MTRLIGVVGSSKQAGKNTVARIIKAIDAGFNDRYDTLDVIENWDNREWMVDDRSNFEIVSFAGKLKQVVSVITGCERGFLDDERFKQSKLGGDWGELSGWSFREILQFVGTDLLRKRFHKDIWVNALFAEWKPKYYSNGITDVEHRMPDWIIADCRFPNEVEAVRSRGGKLVKVVRKGKRKDLHKSETALDGFDDFDAIIKNNGTLLNLIDEVQLAYHKYLKGT